MYTDIICKVKVYLYHYVIGSQFKREKIFLKAPDMK